MSGNPVSRIVFSRRQDLLIGLIMVVVSTGLALGLHVWLKVTVPQAGILWGLFIVGLLALYSIHLQWTHRSVEQARQHDQAALLQLEGLLKRDEENQQLLAAEQKQRQLAQNLIRAYLSIGDALELNRLLDIICEEGSRIFEADAAYLWLMDREDLAGFSAFGEGRDEVEGLHYPLADPQLLGAQVIRQNQPLIINDAPHSRLINQKFIHMFNIKSMIGIPLIRDGQHLGALIVLDNQDPFHFQRPDIETANFLAASVVMAIGNAQYYERSWRQIRQQRALNEINRAITSAMDREAVLDIVLEQVIKQLNVDAASILLIEPQNSTLSYVAGKGFRTYKILHTRLSLEDEYAGRVAREQALISAPDLRDAHPAFERHSILASENFVSYYAVPMISRGNSIGVLEVFHRTLLHVNEEWVNFFKTMAAQAVIAVETTSLVMDLRRANDDLNEAYDATIMGWASALELRDSETEGHTQRVARLAVELARSMGFDEAQLIQLRRGALLHDIGKVGIPDAILLKAGKLSVDEEQIMHKHSQYAVDMLAQVSYLKDALDIPHYHHENWDGSGYPRGLTAQEIPLAARIFSVADVYDAMTTDRPYRKALSSQEVLLYLHDQAGKRFDPEVVQAFISMAGATGSDTGSWLP